VMDSAYADSELRDWLRWASEGGEVPKFVRTVANAAPKLAGLRAEHERFGVDLDKFERQMVSYGLPKDPTVILTLGSRMICEMHAHLEA